MPHVAEEGYTIDANGYYTTKVHYNTKMDCLVDQNEIGFKFAYGVEKVFDDKENNK
jgi:hypothetical protein